MTLEHVLPVAALAIGALLGFLVAKKAAASALAATTRQLDEAVIEAAHARMDAESLKLENRTLEEKNRGLEEKNEEIRRAIDEERKQTSEAQKQAMEQFFKAAAAEALKKQSDELDKTNSRQIGDLLKPIQEKMQEFKKAVEEQKTAHTRETSAVEEQIKAMMAQTQGISDTAKNLAEALRSKNKVLGNWGEKILKTVLTNAGLLEGKEYDFVTQETLRDEFGKTVKSEETGKSLIPDVILNLPENRCIVIDSKAVISNFADYVNAEDPVAREEALKRHLDAVETQAELLRKKGYEKYVKATGRVSLPYVVLFIPNESAFQLYFAERRDKWHELFEQGVIVTGESNLFAMLRIVQMAWEQVKYQKNLENVKGLANELVVRASEFLGRFATIGGRIDALRKAYDEAGKKLVSSKSSVKATAKKLCETGAIEKKLADKFDVATDANAALPEDPSSSATSYLSGREDEEAGTEA